MPAKVQLKLLSNSGELLNVANCCAGRVAVLRAAAPSALRPYQRALSGSSGRDNLEIICDGSPFNPDDHTLIGFGEPSPTTGLTVKEFATGRGISELALSTQLLSVGLEDVIDKRCAELTLDQEARLRLLAATGDPDKVIVLNDPFENISSKWRERIAELLADFARSRNALIIIPSLSYRPEAWISNETIERIEVGQTSQRTIGFGSAGSHANAPIDDIRNQLRSDPRFAGQVIGQDSKGLAGAAMTGVAAGIRPSDLDPNAASAVTQPSWGTAVGKLLFALLGSSVGGWAIFTAVSIHNSQSGKASAPVRVATVTQPPVVKGPDQGADTKQPSAEKAAGPEHGKDLGKDHGNAASVAASALNLKPAEGQTAYLLDSYSEEIKASILETVRGTIDFRSQSEPAAPERAANPTTTNSGNLFSLLEAASNSKSEPSGAYQGDATYMESDVAEDTRDAASISAEEAQREAIRQRFLAAIQASAQRRQQETEEQMN